MKDIIHINTFSVDELIEDSSTTLEIRQPTNLTIDMAPMNTVSTVVSTTTTTTDFQKDIVIEENDSDTSVITIETSSPTNRHCICCNSADFNNAFVSIMLFLG